MPRPITLAIMQPYFLPYLGYFQLMAAVDTLVLYDDVNFINRGWINRNRFNLNGTAHMQTIPLQHASQNKRICDIHISDAENWRDKTLKTIRQAYAGASQYARVYPLVEAIIKHPADNLADYLHHSLIMLLEHLGMPTRLVGSSRAYGNQALKAQARIIDICQREHAERYINAIGGVELYDRAAFEAHGLQLAFLRPALPAYDTGAVPFVPGLSIVDVLMHNPPDAMQELLHAGTLA